MIENFRQLQQERDEKNGYSISCNADYRCQLVFTRSHPFCHALNDTSFEQETLLHQGRWLVVLFYVWSVPDLVGFGSAMKIVAQFGGQIHMAAQPFEGSAYHWHPAIVGIPSSPLYLLFQEGKLIEMKTHFLEPEQLTQWLQEFIAR